MIIKCRLIKTCCKRASKTTEEGKKVERNRRAVGIYNEQRRLFTNLIKKYLYRGELVIYYILAKGL